MASFRIRTPAEYLKLLWRRRYFVLVPSLIVTSALGYAISKLPNVYESKTSIIVDPPKVSSSYVQPVNQIDLNSRLNSIQKQVTSRTELQRLINRYNLYPEIIARGTPIELVIDEMNRFIYVQPYSAPSGIYAFQISYRGPDPRTVRDVTAELAARFIDANSDETRRQVYTTIDQLEGRINEVKTELEKIESARAGFLIKNPDAVQGQEQNMLGQMNSLSLVRQSQQTSIDALRNQIAMSEQLLGSLRTQESTEPEAPLAAGQTEGQLRAKRADLDAQLKQLLTVYTEKHPDVIKLKVQIESINREMEDLKTKTEQERLARRAARTSNPQVQSLDIKIAADRRDLTRKEAELEQTNRQFAELQSRLRGTPLLATEATKIERDYNTLRRRYDDLLAMRDNAKFSAKVINDFSGETFRMSDPANLPEAPVSPKRNLLYPMALAVGLLTGLIAAAAFETRALLTIRDTRDVSHYTKLPLLVAVPKIVTEQERRWRPMINLAKLFALAVLIPLAALLLYQGIKYSRLLNMVTGSY
jgi:polysaccharide chain length determinant protein (PEP-CTERM system associated)